MANKLTYRQWCRIRETFVKYGAGHGGYPEHAERYQEESESRNRLAGGNRFYVTNPAMKDSPH